MSENVVSDPPPLFAGRYQLLGTLGHGGMATVFRAEDTVLGRIVAIKVLREGHADDERVRERFHREARAAAAIDDPHVVAIYDVGDTDGRPFIIMEYVPGPTLASALKETPIIPVQAALAVGRGVATALAAAHGLGIVHRDVKPANIILDERGGGVKLADFGVAQAAREMVELTDPGISVGSALYAAPEQGLDTHVTPAADLYSLGVILYEMLVGSVPFASGTAVQLGIRRLTEAAPSLREGAPDAAFELVTLVDGLLAIDPTVRPTDANVVAEALGMILADTKVS